MFSFDEHRGRVYHVPLKTIVKSFDFKNEIKHNLKIQPQGSFFLEFKRLCIC
jgi:hypothetical protein